MTSAINSTSIVTTFPVAGKDNDSQGFRDNFAATSAALSVTKTEITRLQDRTLKAADLLSDNGTPVANDLLKSTIKNGQYSQFNGVLFNIGDVAGSAIINIDNGPIQRTRLTGGTSGAPAVLNFTNWPSGPSAASVWSVIRIVLIGDQQAVRYVTFTSENAGTIKPATGFTLPVVLATNGKYQVIEAWTMDKGVNVFIKNIGEY